MRFSLALSPVPDIDEVTAYLPAALSYLHGGWSANFQHPMFIKLLFAGSILVFGQHGSVSSLFPWLDGNLFPSLPPNVGAIRLVSVVTGAATCLVVYYLVKEITGRKTLAMVAGLVLVFDPFSMGVSSYGILDPGMTFFYMLSILFFYRYVKDERVPNLLLCAVSFGLAVASKYYAVMAVFVFVGILVWKRKGRRAWLSFPLLLVISAAVFFAVQPYLWSNTWHNLNISWDANNFSLTLGHPVKPPGNPFLINVNGTQFQRYAPKPDFPSTPSAAVPSPWWYIFYILAMYSTPFELVVYPLAGYVIVSSIIRRRTNDLSIIGSILVLIPSLWFAIQSVRLPQYATVLVASAAVLGPVGVAGLGKERERWLIAALVLLQVGWTLYALVGSASHFTGWGFYNTPLTPLLGNLFGKLWNAFH